jgi:hypothetical protein
VKQPKGFLLPDQSDEVELEFNSGAIRGKVEKYVNITTNDPTSQYVTVKLVAEIKEILQPLSGSYSLYLNEAIIGKPATKRVAMKNVSGLPINIRGDSVSSASVSIKVDKKILQQNDTLNVDVTVIPNKLGPAFEYFYIITNHKILPRVETKITIIGTKEN